MKLTCFIFVIILLSFLSCHQEGEKEHPTTIQPKIVEAIGYTVPHDSMAAPKVILVDESRLKKTTIINPKVVVVNTNVHQAGKPKVVVAGSPRICTPGLGKFSLPKIVPAIHQSFKAGQPEIVEAKDAYGKDHNPHNFSSFSKQQGLKNAFVNYLYEDSRGNIWICTNSTSQTKYNGKTFTHFAEQSGLVESIGTSICEDKQGNLWFGSYGDGISKYDGKYFTNFTKTEGLSYNEIWCILEDRKGNLWIGTNGGGVNKFDGKSFTHYTEKEGLLHNLVSDALEDHMGNLWFATEGGICKFDGTSFYHFTEKEGISNNAVNSVLEDEQGNLWIATYGGGINKFDGKSFTHYTQKQGLSNNNVFSIKQDELGNFWTTSNGGGVNKFDGHSFEYFTENEGLFSNEVITTMDDKYGNIWIATFGGGISKYGGETFTHLTDEEGLSNKFVISILEDSVGNLWLGTDGGGINKCEFSKDGLTRTFTWINEMNGLSNNYVRSILNDREGNFWFGTKDGLNRLELSPNGTSFITQYSENDGLPNKFVTSLIEDKFGNIWIGTEGGGASKISRNKKTQVSTFENFSVDQGLTDNVITSILEDKRGNIWFGTFGGGANMYIPSNDGKSGSFIHYTKEEGLSNNNVRSMLEDSNGNIWFGTDAGGVNKYEPSKDGHTPNFTCLTEKVGLSNNAVLSILEDKVGNLWFGTRYGLSKLTPQKLADFSTDLQSRNIKESDVFFKNYTFENGFLGIGCSINSICEDKNGTIWIGANDRLTAYHPGIGNFNPDTVPVSIEITGILLFNESISWQEIEHRLDTSFELRNGVQIKNVRFDSTSKWYDLPENLSLGYKNNYLSFNFMGITTNQPKQVKYQYILEGNDENWSALTSSNEAHYGNLSSGTYTFKVKAMNSAGYWSDEFHYSFDIRPPWWRTWYAFSSYLALLIITIYSSFKFQKRRIVIAENRKSNQKQAVLNERLRISRDLHDELGSTLSGIVMYSHLAKGQARERKAEAEHSINVVQQSASDMVTKLNDVVWLVNPINDNLEKLIKRLEEYAIQIASAKNMNVVMQHEENLGNIILPVDTRRSIYMFCKEAINNAVKYSGGTAVQLDVHQESRSLKFRIKDNGTGFDPESIKPGNGLNNMQKRADEIGAKMILESHPDHGTTVSLLCRLEG